MKDFPKLSCKVLMAPKLDEKVKTQIRNTGKDPHYGAEKSLCSNKSSWIYQVTNLFVG